MSIELTPAWISGRLLPEETSKDERVIVEAMIARAIEQVAQTGGTIPAMFFAIEKLIVQASRQILIQHQVRCDRAFRFITELLEMPDFEEETDKDLDL